MGGNPLVCTVSSLLLFGLFALLGLNSLCARELFCASNVSPPMAALVGRGLDLPDSLVCAARAAEEDEEGEEVVDVERDFNRSSVARIRASRASNSDVWEETAFFLFVT